MGEYAAHRGVSKARISQAIGPILSLSCVEHYYIGKKKHTRINPIIADMEWERNAPRSPRSTPLTAPAMRGGILKPEEKQAKDYLDKTGVYTPKAKPAPRSQPGQRATIEARQALNRASKGKVPQQSKSPLDSLSEEQQELLDLNIRRKRAETTKLEADSLNARINVEREAMLLVDADEMEDQYSAIIADARDMLLATKESMQADVPGLPVEAYDYVDKRVREFLAMLGAPKRERVAIANRVVDEC